MLNNKKTFITKFVVVILCFLTNFQSLACKFPSIYINHYASPVLTSVDGGSSTWFNPLISGQYDGCYLGISDVHNFTLTAGQEHGVELFQYYAVVGNSNHTCQNYDIYGSLSPLTGRYQALCQSSARQLKDCTNNPTDPCCQSLSNCDATQGSAPGICLVYEDVLISWAFSNCVNQYSFPSVLTCMDQPAGCTGSIIPNIDQCATNGSAGFASGGCFPYPLPPSPPPFCDQIPIVPQTAVYLPICDAGYSNADICGEPSTPGNYSTYMNPCARVTFNNYISDPSVTPPALRLMPICLDGSTGPSCIVVNQNPPSTPSGITPIYAEINQSAYGAIGMTGQVEAIYTQTLNSGTSQTRWNSAPQPIQANSPPPPLTFYGYNFAPLQDLCYNFATNQNSTVSMTDNYGVARSFRTCLQSGSNNTYCVEESTGTSPSGSVCATTNPYCFNVPEMDIPAVTFCSANNSINTPDNYCLQVTSETGNYTFTSGNLSQQGIFTVVQTDNNYSLPNGKTSLCTPYYDPNNNTYGTAGGNTIGNCEYYAGLSYNSSSTYQSGATKLCLNGYQPNDMQDIVCNSSLDPNSHSNTGSPQINYRSQPAASEPSPLYSSQCCNPVSGSPSNPCPPPPSPQILGSTPFRSKNPLELGLCVDIMPFTLQPCGTLKTPQLVSDCNAYTDLCTLINSPANVPNGNAGTNAYVNGDICNKNFIDCSLNPNATPPNQPSMASNVCQFYAPNQ